MLDMLRTGDPPLAATRHPNILGRILRALEVLRLTGVPMSEHQRRSKLCRSEYRLCMLGLNFADRSLLYERINRRVDRMMEAGLVEEARAVSRRYGGTARQAIGYKELQPYFGGTLPLEACVENLKQATRRYAKRQLTCSEETPASTGCCRQYESERELLREAQNTVHNSSIL
jgi:tRNA dimethylallyltransferase